MQRQTVQNDSAGLRKAELCGLKIGDLNTYRNQAVIDVIGKGQKFRRIPLNTATLLAIKEHLKVTGNGTHPNHPLLQTLGKHGLYQEKGLTPKAVDCLVRSVVKKALIQKRVHPHVMWHTFTTPQVFPQEDR